MAAIIPIRAFTDNCVRRRRRESDDEAIAAPHDKRQRFPARSRVRLTVRRVAPTIAAAFRGHTIARIAP